MKIGVIVANFGGPQREDELVPFLSRLFQDVLPGPAWLKNVFVPSIAKRRARVVGPHYAAIGWSRVISTNELQVAALKDALGSEAPPVATGMMFSAPEFGEAIKELEAQGVDALIVLPMFPHFSLATTNTAFAFLHQALKRTGNAHWPVHYIPAYYDHPLYVRAVAETIRDGLAQMDESGPVELVFTAHGLPVSYPLKRGDPYPEHVRHSVRAIVDQLNWQGPWHIGWQSRIGPVRWLQPSTIQLVEDLGRSGTTRILFVPLSFVSEHIETLYEIDIELSTTARTAGIRDIGRASTLDARPQYIQCLVSLIIEAQAHFHRYTCVRCLVPKPDAHRRQSICRNCHFVFPAYLREAPLASDKD
jgi:ferrochelatase